MPPLAASQEKTGPVQERAGEPKRWGGGTEGVPATKRASSAPTSTSDRRGRPRDGRPLRLGQRVALAVLAALCLTACDANPATEAPTASTTPASPAAKSAERARSYGVSTRGDTTAGSRDANELPDANAVSPTDTGSPDAGSPDAGSPDARPPDARPPDAGVQDAGSPDASLPDAGAAVHRYFFTGQCEGVFVYIVSVSVETPEESTTSLSLTPSGTGRVRGVGDRIGAFEVMRIDEDWTGLNPRVWLRERDSVCYATLAGNEIRKQAARSRATASKRKAAARRKKAAARKRKARRQRKQRKQREARRRRQRRKERAEREQDK